MPIQTEPTNKMQARKARAAGWGIPFVPEDRFCSDPKHCVCKTDYDMARCPRSSKGMEE